jgi:EAL domain-containing protein (putative c-di-GMP-specific phosphodiesterase class I)/DNA-binding NarL/FixJ family response regulator
MGPGRGSRPPEFGSIVAREAALGLRAFRAGRVEEQRAGLVRRQGTEKAMSANGRVANRVRVLVADDDPELRESLIHLVSVEPTLALVGAAANAQQAIALASQYKPEVALVDARMRGGGGARVAREARFRAPETRILALSAYDDREVVMAMLGAGVTGYISKHAAPQEIVAAIRRCAKGLATLSREVTVSVIEEIAGHIGTRRCEADALRQRTITARRMFRDEGLRMALQPIVDLGDYHVEGVEALARFTFHPDWGPMEWFGEADAVGLRVELEQAALEMAVAEVDRLPDGWFLAVNLSPEALISEGATRCLERIPVDRVIVEVTEHAQVADYGGLLRAMADFRARGGKLAIDDAGAGFASLRHVLVLLPDVIKLDMSLTQGIDSDRSRRALASALVSFASETDADIIAEGIETKGELETLRSLGVRYGQGFYLSRPLMLLPGEDPADAFREIPATAA